mgnify:CR=1 FL=1
MTLDQALKLARSLARGLRFMDGPAMPDHIRRALGAAETTLYGATPAPDHQSEAYSARDTLAGLMRGMLLHLDGEHGTAISIGVTAAMAEAAAANVGGPQEASRFAHAYHALERARLDALTPKGGTPVRRSPEGEGG